MGDFLYVYTKTYRFKKLLGHFNWINKRPSSNNGTGRVVSNAKKQTPSALICYSYAVFIQFLVIELCLGFFEFQALVF